MQKMAKSYQHLPKSSRRNPANCLQERQPAGARAPSKGILKKSTKYINNSDDLNNSSALIQEEGFTAELIKARKIILKSKTISFLEKDEVRTFDKENFDMKRGAAMNQEKCQISPEHCSRLLE